MEGAFCSVYDNSSMDEIKSEVGDDPDNPRSGESSDDENERAA